MDIVHDIIFLPRRRTDHGNLSPVELLKQADYFRNRQQITEESLRAALHRHPECVEDWLLWSQDKRTREGWYFTRQDTGRYLVGYLSRKSGASRQQEYSEAISACAAFIVRELEGFPQP